MARIQDRIGFGFRPSDAVSAIDKIVRAEESGFSTAWTVMPALNRDTPTILHRGCDAGRRDQARHVDRAGLHTPPLALAEPRHWRSKISRRDRLRLGIGTSHQRTMIAAYGFEFTKPLTQLREYLTVLRTALNDGKVDIAGEFYTAHAAFQNPPGTPVLISASRARLRAGR